MIQHLILMSKYLQMLDRREQMFSHIDEMKDHGEMFDSLRLNVGTEREEILVDLEHQFGEKFLSSNIVFWVGVVFFFKC